MSGSTLLQMMLGSMYCWSSFLVYAPRRLQTLWMIPMQLTTMGLMGPLSAALQLRFGSVTMSRIGLSICVAAVFASSYVTAGPLAPFLLLYGFVFGVGASLAYSATLQPAFAYFPHRKGMVSGIVMGGYGVGSFLLNYVGSYAVNPTQVPLVWRETRGWTVPRVVRARFPTMLRVMALVYGLMSLVGLKLQRMPPEEGAKEKVAECDGQESVWKLVRSRTFLTLSAMGHFSAFGCFTVASAYRKFGMQAGVLHTDALGATIGAVGALANGLTRPIWGELVDRFGVRFPWLLLAALQTVALATYTASAAAGPWSFVVATTVVYACLGGSWAIASTALARSFGTGKAPALFSIIFNAYSLSSILGPFLAGVLVPRSGWAVLFRLTAFSAFLSGCVALCYREAQPPAELH